MQEKSLFNYDDYKKYLNDYFDSKQTSRGNRSAMARAIDCQTAYVSSVLRGVNHFTPEQAEAINIHIGHSEAESDYFFLLLQFQRAGTEALKRRIKKQIEKIRQERFNLKKRLQVSQSLSFSDQAKYYSEWYFSAVHTLSSIPGFQNITSIATYLNLDTSLVAEIIDFLLSSGLLESVKHEFRIGKTHIHLGSDSPLISKHHINWRLQAMQKLSLRTAADNLHYSSTVTLSQADVVRIKEMIIQLIKNSKEIIRKSPEETLQCFAIDFFKI